jgi:uncharacterized membrane protein
MAPYYTGLIAHVPGSDVVLPVRLVRLTAKGAGFFLMRLQENRPIAISAPCIGMAFVLYVVASISTVAVACKESESRVPI